PARRREREPGRHRPIRQRPRRADRHRRVHHGEAVVAGPAVDLPVLDVARETLSRARDHVLALQHAGGWWQGELETNVTMDAEDLLLRQFLGVRDEAATAAAARWIRSQQRADGPWATCSGGPADVSTWVEADVALRLGGHQTDEPHLRTARHWILA